MAQKGGAPRAPARDEEQQYVEIVSWSERVYIKATPVTKTGTVIARKEDIVKAIAKTLSTPFAALKSLGKATKADLEQLQASLARFEPEAKESDPE